MSECHLTEESIRPEKIFSNYLELCAEDCSNFFPLESFSWRDCPLCRAKIQRKEPDIRKYNFNYMFCDECDSIFNNPAPSRKSLMEFYQVGKSVKYWVSDFYRYTAENRSRLIVRPKAELLLRDLVSVSLRVENCEFFDIGAGYGLFLRELGSLVDGIRAYAIEPGPDFANSLRNFGFSVINKFVEELEEQDFTCSESCSHRVFVSHELIEHLLEPLQFLKSLRSVMRKGDCLSFTTLTASGFDILYLLEASKAIHPPHHLSFFSVNQIERALVENNFEIIRLSTPGELDVEIVKKSEKYKSDRLMQALLDNQDAAQSFQRFLKDTRRSSHINVFCRAV